MRRAKLRRQPAGLPPPGLPPAALARLGRAVLAHDPGGPPLRTGWYASITARTVLVCSTVITQLAVGMVRIPGPRWHVFAVMAALIVVQWAPVLAAEWLLHPRHELIVWLAAAAPVTVWLSTVAAAVVVACGDRKPAALYTRREVASASAHGVTSAAGREG